MLILGPIGFSAPLLLWALAALPVLWILLRAVPPAPVRRLFPAVTLLLGLKDRDSQSARTPWWLLLLRMLVLAAVILGFAGPVLNPKSARQGSGPVLIIMDAGWASAGDWRARQARVSALVNEAGRSARPVALLLLADPDPGVPVFVAAETLAHRVGGLEPAPWQPAAELPQALTALAPETRFDSWWFSDGLARDGRADLFDLLSARGTVTVFEPGRQVFGLTPPEQEENLLRFSVQRNGQAGAAEIEVRAIGPDPAGRETTLASGLARFEAGAQTATLELVLPSELRNRVTRFVLADQAAAGAVVMVDDGLRRREIALISGRSDQETLELLDPLYYLRRALEPDADLISGALGDVLPARPDVIILADVAELTNAEQAGLLAWVEAGGMLLRFAGPRLAASDIARNAEDPLLPVRLRRGGRSVGGAMSWGAPKTLLPFDENSPFYGLEVPGDVAVTSQVVAQPGPELAGRVIAALADGTPLVTRKRIGAGRVVLFHVTANAEWSSLPLSGLFVGMLERLSVLSRPPVPDVTDLAGTTWIAERVLDGFGRPGDADAMAGISGEAFAGARPGPGLPPGLYRNDTQFLALNVLAPGELLQAASWPPGTRIEGFAARAEQQLKGWLLLLASGLLGLDALASLWLTGRFVRLRGVGKTFAVLGAFMFLVVLPSGPRAQEGTPAADRHALRVTSDVVLAHVLTGDRSVDQIAEAGLRGLSRALARRTSVEPAAPVGVDPERDELSFFPFLYWPVTAEQPVLSARASQNLNQYLRTGGMILFDTRDAGISGSNGPNQRRLRRLALPLDIPALEPVPSDHVLTRAFYLLQDFPGRYNAGVVWVEAAPPGAELVEGMPFRNLNDGVTPVVIGGNDWAAAWAVNENGQALFQVGRGRAGERQREIAYRFGINLIMHVLTGNYKSDQVHVPALLDRLGQ